MVGCFDVENDSNCLFLVLAVESQECQLEVEDVRCNLHYRVSNTICYIKLYLVLEVLCHCWHLMGRGNVGYVLLECPKLLLVKGA